MRFSENIQITAEKTAVIFFERTCSSLTELIRFIYRGEKKV